MSARLRSLFISLGFCLPLLPVLLLFEMSIQASLESTKERLRLHWQYTANRMIEAGQPQTLLYNRIRQEFPAEAWVPFTPQNGKYYVERLKHCLQVPHILVLFDPQCRIFHPSGSFPNKHKLEAIWHALSNYILGRQITDETKALEKAARRHFFELFGEHSFEKLRFAKIFQWVITVPGTPKRYGMVIAPRVEKSDQETSGMLVEVSERDIQKIDQAKGAISLLAADIPFGAILDRGTGTVLESRGQAWFHPSAVGSSTDSPAFIHTAAGFLFQANFSKPSSLTVLLAAPLPFPASIPLPIRGIIAAGLLLAAGMLGSRLTPILLGETYPSASLAWQILFSFGFSSIIPIFALLLFGINRWSNLDRLEQENWIERVRHALQTHDRTFRNQCERLQHDCVAFGNQLNLASHPERFNRDDTPEALKRAFSIFFVNTREQKFLAEARNRQTQELTDKVNRTFANFSRLLCDIFLLIQTERGQKTENPGGGQEKLKLNLMDILGENNPILYFLKNTETLSSQTLNETNLLSYSYFLQTADRLSGFFIAIFELVKIADTSVRELVAEDHLGETPITPFVRLPSGSLLPQHFAEVPDVRQLLEIGRQSQFTQVTQVGIKQRDYLLVTEPTRSLDECQIGIGIAAHILQESRNQLQTTIGTWLLLGVGFILLVAGLVRRRLLQPVLRLAEGAETVRRADYGIRLAVTSADEIGELTQMFNEMTQGLQERERMKRFVSESLQESLKSGRSEDLTEPGRKVNVAVLFSDIRDFTTLSEQHPADEVVNMLNEYFTIMDQAIRREQGDIRKLIGDAILAVFAELPSGLPPTLRACRAAQAMRDGLATFNQERLVRGLFPIRTGIGIQYGPVIEGDIGSESGLFDRTIIGSALDGAQRLESLSKKGVSSQVLLTREAFSLIAPEGFSGLPLDEDPNVIELNGWAAK